MSAIRSRSYFWVYWCFGFFSVEQKLGERGVMIESFFDMPETLLLLKLLQSSLISSIFSFLIGDYLVLSKVKPSSIWVSPSCMLFLTSAELGPSNPTFIISFERSDYDLWWIFALFGLGSQSPMLILWPSWLFLLGDLIGDRFSWILYRLIDLLTGSRGDLAVLLVN